VPEACFAFCNYFPSLTYRLPADIPASSRSMTDLKRLRLICGLRQLDVWAATGIQIQRLSQAERGRYGFLSDPEINLLQSFFRQRLEQVERERIVSRFEVAPAGSSQY
jgi:hypothetical protein